MKLSMKSRSSVFYVILWSLVVGLFGFIPLIAQQNPFMTESEKRAKRLEVETLFNQAGTTDDKLRYGFELASFIATENYDSAVALSEALLNIALDNNNNVFISQSYFAYGNLCVANQRSSEALYLFQKGLPYLEKKGVPPHMKASFHQQISLIYENMGFLEKAVEHLLISNERLYSLPKTIRRDMWLARQLNSLANLFAENGQHQKAIPYARSSIELATGIEEWNVVSGAWFNIGKYASVLGDQTLKDEAFAKAAEFQELAKKKRRYPDSSPMKQ